MIFRCTRTGFTENEEQEGKSNLTQSVNDDDDEGAAS
jgi:hypothetical protein